MICPECQAPLEITLRCVDALFVGESQRPAGLFARVRRCWDCGRSEACYTKLAWRPVTLADTDLLWQWRDDPDTRQHSWHREPLDPRAHAAWMRRLLTSPYAHLWWQLALLTDLPVGVVRISLFTAPPELHITVAPAYRGVGVGTAMLALAAIPQGTIARVAGTNPASLQAFAQAGWAEQEQVFVWRKSSTVPN